MPISSKDIAYNFVAGGVLVAGTAWLASKYSTKMAALFWSLPITLIPLILFLHYKKAPQEDINEFVGNIIPSLILLLSYTFGLWVAFKNTDFWKAIGISMIVLAIFIAIFWIVVSPGGKARIQ